MKFVVLSFSCSPCILEIVGYSNSCFSIDMSPRHGLQGYFKPVSTSIEHFIFYTTLQAGLYSCFREPCALSEILQSLASSEILGDDRCILEIRRSHVLRDTMKEACKSKFTAKKRSKVFCYYHSGSDIWYCIITGKYYSSGSAQVPPLEHFCGRTYT